MLSSTDSNQISVISSYIRQASFHSENARLLGWWTALPLLLYCAHRIWPLHLMVLMSRLYVPCMCALELASENIISRPLLMFNSILQTLNVPDLSVE